MSLFDDASLVLIPDGAKDSKLYSVKPTDGSGDFTFSRSTTATRVNDSGLIESVATNVPRIDYSEGGCPSLLLEPQRTNLLTYSEEFDDAVWVKSSGVTITANQATSPDGTTTADQITRTTSGNAEQSSVVTSGQDYVFSCFAKADDATTFSMVMTSAFPATVVVFNFSDGSGSATTGTPVNFGFEDYGNGWYRFYMVQTANASSTGSFRLLVSNNTSAFIWGAQLEAGSYPTSYIPTNGAAVTRNADSCELTGVSSLIGQTEGTILFKTDFSDSTIIHVLGENLTVTDEQVKIEYSSTQIKFYLNDSLIATKNGTFDFSGTDEIELGNYLGGSQLGGHISNFVTV